MNKPSDIEILADSGWEHVKNSSIPSRGINDYVRCIKFADKLSADKLKEVCGWLASDKCPGWTGVQAYRRS